MPEADINELSYEDLNRNADKMTRRIKKPDDSFIRFAHLELCFLEHNLPMIGRLPVKTQELLFWIVGRIKNINDLFEQLDREFERSFICSSNNVERIMVNKKLCYDKIATISYLTANEVMEFLRQNWICSNSGNHIILT
jgi:hypothetical protein